MSKEDRRRFNLIKQKVKPARIYELAIAVLSANEWAASAALVGGNDRRFRFSGGKLFDEATIGDARV